MVVKELFSCIKERIAISFSCSLFFSLVYDPLCRIRTISPLRQYDLIVVLTAATETLFKQRIFNSNHFIACGILCIVGIFFAVTLRNMRSMLSNQKTINWVYNYIEVTKTITLFCVFFLFLFIINIVYLFFQCTSLLHYTYIISIVQQLNCIRQKNGCPTPRTKCTDIFRLI